MNDIAITLGQAFIPILIGVLNALDPAINAVAKAADWFQKLSPAIRGTVLVFGALLAAAGPVLIILGQLTIAMAAVTGSFVAAKIASAGLAVGVGVLSFKITQMAIEWAGAREMLDRYYLQLFSLTTKGRFATEEELKALKAIQGLAGKQKEPLNLAAKAAEEFKKEIGDALKEITTGVGKASPHTTKAVQDGIDMVKNETSKVTEKVVKGIKNQQAA